MKIYSFETITSIEDVRQIPSYVPLGEQVVLIPPSFPWIKDQMQDIAISLYNFDLGKIPSLIDGLKTRVRDKDCVKNRVKRAKIVRFTLC